MSMKNRFIRFLKDHHAFYEFKENLKELRGECFRQYMERSIGHPQHYLTSAYPWEQSKQGFNFWRKIQMLWREEVIRGVHNAK